MSNFSVRNKDEWKWTAMIMQPGQITETIFPEALEELKKKKKMPCLSKIRFERFYEGRSAQIMYIGPFSDEGPTIKKIHEFVTKNDGTLDGRHHEIYLSDHRKVAPEKMKTILRQPCKRK
jgi:hypothetical protein